MRDQLFTCSPGGRKGHGPCGQQEGLGLDCISGNGGGKDGEKEVGGGPMAHGNALALIEDELSSSGQGQGQLQKWRGGLSSLCRALPLWTCFDSGLEGSRGCVGILLFT